MSAPVIRAEPRVPIDGVVAPGFERMLDTFVENFARRGEVGAAVSVYHRGRPVVDLWGGHRDADRRHAWERDTLVCMMSVTKGICAIAALMLVSRGALALDAPVARYWPGFARGGKGSITVRQVLGGFAGLIYLDHAPAGAMLDWEQMVDALEQQEPVWPVGTQGAYHSATGGFLFGEIVRRVDGRPIDRFVREEIAAPLGVEYHIGIAPPALARVAEIVSNPASVTGTAITDPSTKLGRAWRTQPQTDGLLFNDPKFRAAVIPSANGHGNARSVARIFAVLAAGGSLDGVTLLDAATIDLAREPQWEGICGMTERPFRYGLGMFVNHAPMTGFGPNPRAFGHPGVGGFLGFADPEQQISFSYSPNFMCSGAGMGERCEALIASLYAQDLP